MTVPIATRASWGAQFDDGDQTLFGLALEVFVHHSVTAQLPLTATVAAEQEQMRKLEATGQDRFGHGISYNVVIFPSGRAYQGVSWSRRGAHTGGRNSTARSICFAGNYEIAQPTPAALATAAAIYDEGRGELWRSDAPVRGHRAVSFTDCPGEYLYAQLPVIAAGRTTTQEDDMATAEEIADEIWGRTFSVPPEMRDELGEKPRTMPQLLASALVRTDRAEAVAREALAAANAALTVARQVRTKTDRVEDAVDDIPKET